MAKFKPLNENQLVMLPISLQDQLVPGTLEHTISELVEKHLDLSIFDARYNNDETGATAIHPKILLKVILLASARGLISSGKIEQACRENRTFMALACGQAPDQHECRLCGVPQRGDCLPLARYSPCLCGAGFTGGHSLCCGWR